MGLSLARDRIEWTCNGYIQENYLKNVINRSQKHPKYEHTFQREGKLISDGLVYSEMSPFNRSLWHYRYIGQSS